MTTPVEWYYHRTGCTGCARAAAFMESHGIVPAETVPASRKLQRDAAERLARGAQRIIVSKGRRSEELRGGRAVTPAVVDALLGPTGNLRAPCVKTAHALLVGFDAGAFREVLVGD